MILSETTAEITRGDLPSPDLRIRGTGTALSLLFLERRPGGRLPPAVDVEGSAAHVRELLAVFATKELEPTEVGSS
jgi:hypothetical protein